MRRNEVSELDTGSSPISTLDALRALVDLRDGARLIEANAADDATIDGPLGHARTERPEASNLDSRAFGIAAAVHVARLRAAIADAGAVELGARAAHGR